MGAVVEIVGSAVHTLTVFTDGAGFFSVPNLTPGQYSLKVSAPSFLAAMHEKVALQPGTSIRLNITLNTLLNGLRVGPLRGTANDDDWKWTLRSVANRPVLRVFGNPGTDVEQHDHNLKASLSFLAGSAADGYGSGSDVSTGFSVERSIFSMSRVGLSGHIGYGESLPSAVLRATYSHSLLDGSGPSLALTMRRFAPSDPNLHYAALQALAFNAGDDIAVGDVVEIEFGSELQTIQFLGHVTAFRPYGSIDVHALSRHSCWSMAMRPRCPTLGMRAVWTQRLRI